MFSASARKLNFLQKMHMERPDLIFLVRGRDNSGERAWYYVQIDKSKREQFKTREGAPFLSLTDYGQILYSGYGEDPPESIKQLMEGEYGFRD